MDLSKRSGIFPPIGSTLCMKVAGSIPNRPEVSVRCKSKSRLVLDVNRLGFVARRSRSMKPRDRTQMHTFRVLGRGMLTLLRRKSVWVELCTVAGFISVLAFFSSGDVGRARRRLAQTMSTRNVPSYDGVVVYQIAPEV